MKIFERGFTLAEVLVTMALIGVVAAMTVPTVMMDGKYKQYVAKIAKFNSSLESAATEYAVTHDDFSSGTHVLKFIRNSFIYKNKDEKGKFTSFGTVDAELKDGTIIHAAFYINPSANDTFFHGEPDTDITGEPCFQIYFNPNVPGMSGFDNSLAFEVSEKGYVFPLATSNASTNRCLKALYDNKWKYSPSFFKSGGACKTSS